jgi:MinD-like ATPase involved in chromosome partitioning or flagellar assembly
VPGPYRPAASIHRPSGSVRSAAPSAPAAARPSPSPPPRERPPGGTALDGLDEPDTSDASGLGWREWLHRLTGIDLGQSKESKYEKQLRERIRAVVGGAFPIAVLNLKGGVGKTTVVEALGSTFADVRHDRVIALDIDAGDLAERHGRPSPLSLADLVADDAVVRYTDVRAHTYMNTFGLEVLGLPDYARTDWRLERHDVVKAFSVLRNHYSIVLVDCVKSLNSAVMEAVLPESRALVVVTSTSLDALRKTKTTLDWLSHNGYGRLLKSTILAVNHVDPTKVSSLAAKEIDALSARVGRTVVLPFDQHIHEGRRIELDRLSKESRRSYLQMAAALADMVAGPRRRSAGIAAPRSPGTS